MDEKEFVALFAEAEDYFHQCGENGIRCSLNLGYGCFVVEVERKEGSLFVQTRKCVPHTEVYASRSLKPAIDRVLAVNEAELKRQLALHPHAA